MTLKDKLHQAIDALAAQYLLPECAEAITKSRIEAQFDYGLNPFNSAF